MDTAVTLSRQGQRLLQAGLLLILDSPIDGFAIPLLASQRIGLSVHILSAFQGAAPWGVGNETTRLMGELPHGLTRGTARQETVIKVLAYSSAPTGLTAFGLMLWGLRLPSISDDSP
jgi:hydroxylaminobenzene mutase